MTTVQDTTVTLVPATAEEAKRARIEAAAELTEVTAQIGRNLGYDEGYYEGHNDGWLIGYEAGLAAAAELDRV